MQSFRIQLQKKISNIWRIKLQLRRDCIGRLSV